MLAVPSADFELHNTLFLVAHFHNVIIGGVLFGLFAAINFWWPKATGFKLDPFWGRVSFWFWIVGFWVAFAPLYVLGLMGATRRLSHFDDPSWQIWFEIAAVGAGLIFVGIVAFLIQIAVSFRRREALRDHTGDPWNGRTLEWSTASPAPEYNFAFTPRVHQMDAWFDMKKRGYTRPSEGFTPIHMPKNTPAGIILAFLAFSCGFGLIWHIWWLAGGAFAGLIATVILHSFSDRRDFYLAAEDVARTEAERSRLLALRG
jgi:cytochrome o ubiquinol oxidase subunit 1